MKIEIFIFDYFFGGVKDTGKLNNDVYYFFKILKPTVCYAFVGFDLNIYNVSVLIKGSPLNYQIFSLINIKDSKSDRGIIR